MSSGAAMYAALEVSKKMGTVVVIFLTGKVFKY
jgi:cysteine synthase